MIQDMLNQVCTYWVGTPNGEGGYNWSPPIQMRCRWQDKQQMVRISPGEEKVSKALVHLPQSISLTSRLHLGISTDDVPPLESSWAPLAIASMNSLDGKVAGYRVWL